MRWKALCICCVGATAALAACHRSRGAGDVGPSPRPCALLAVTVTLPANASTELMRGDFTLTMTATAGARSGATAQGPLSLVPQDSALLEVEGARQPLRGTTRIALDSIGAVPMGDLAATAPEAPGVGVYEQRSAAGMPTVVVRLGSASNARGPQPFDAGHTTLWVKQITPGGFAGGWSSSAGSTFPLREASGYFCAARARP